MCSSKSCCSFVSLPEGKTSFSAPRIDDLFYVENLFREEQKVKKRKKYAKATLSFALDDEPDGADTASGSATPNGGVNQPFLSPTALSMPLFPSWLCPHYFHRSHVLYQRAHVCVGGCTMQGVGVGLTALPWCGTRLGRAPPTSTRDARTDRAHHWFLAWLAHQQRTTRRLTWAHSHRLSVETAYPQPKNGSADILFKFVAGPGVHWLKYRGAWMQVRFPSTAHPFPSRPFIS